MTLCCIVFTARVCEAYGKVGLAVTGYILVSLLVVHACCMIWCSAEAARSAHASCIVAYPDKHDCEEGWGCVLNQLWACCTHLSTFNARIKGGLLALNAHNAKEALQWTLDLLPGTAGQLPTTRQLHMSAGSEAGDEILSSCAGWWCGHLVGKPVACCILLQAGILLQQVTCVAKGV